MNRGSRQKILFFACRSDCLPRMLRGHQVARGPCVDQGLGRQSRRATPSPSCDITIPHRGGGAYANVPATAKRTRSACTNGEDLPGRRLELLERVRRF